MCYIEDSLEVKKFIKTLPIKSNLLVIAKYIETILILLVCQIYCVVINIIVYKSVDISIILKANLIIFIGYFVCIKLMDRES